VWKRKRGKIDSTTARHLRLEVPEAQNEKHTKLLKASGKKKRRSKNSRKRSRRAGVREKTGCHESPLLRGKKHSLSRPFEQ